MNRILLNCFVLICSLCPLTRSAPLEDGFLLRQLADSYSAPLVASFLHLRIQNAIKSIEDIKKSYDHEAMENYSERQQNLLKLKVKGLEALDKQLTRLQKIDYFHSDGTQRLLNMIDQYIMNDDIIPMELGPEKTQFKVTPDDLLKKLGLVSNDDLIRETYDLLNFYLKDIEEKESNENYNELQRLIASLTKRKLEHLLEFRNLWPEDTEEHLKPYQVPRDDRGSQIEFVLWQIKRISDYFYSQFENLKTRRMQSSSWELPMIVKGYPYKAD